MKTARLLVLLAAVLAAVLAGSGTAAGEPEERPPRSGFRKVHVVDFEGEIEPVLEAYLGRRVQAAKDDGADCLVLRIDSPGGRVSSTLDIADLLVGLPESMHTVAWVPERAYSGAAMVAISCREIVMGSGAHLGDAKPIFMTPGEPIVPAGEKLESPLRAKARDYAEKNGHPAILAESMVSEIEVVRVRDPNGATHLVRGEDLREAGEGAEIVEGWKKSELTQVGPPLVGKGRLLTMTARDAKDYGFLDRTFRDAESGDARDFPRDEAELLKALVREDGVVSRYGMTFSEKASRVLLQYTAVLSAIVTLSVVLMLFTGHLGVFGLAGGISLVLIVLIHATAGLLSGFPIFLVVVGVLLLAVEVFVIPGFTLAGIAGIGLMAVGFFMLAVGASFGSPGDMSGAAMLDFAWKFVATLIAGFSLVLLLSRWAPRIGPGRRLLLAPPAPSGGVPAPAEAHARVGEVGVAVTPLRPAGTAEIGGRLADVVSDGEFVERGTTVRVVRVEGPTVAVLPVPEGEGV